HFWAARPILAGPPMTFVEGVGGRALGVLGRARVLARGPALDLDRSSSAQEVGSADFLRARWRRAGPRAGQRDFRPLAELFTMLKRAGADRIITYAALDLARLRA
ncbi:hypothetical protein ACFVUZ_41230, partial [Kitasatospora sp. NPDC058060]